MKLTYASKLAAGMLSIVALTSAAHAQDAKSEITIEEREVKQRPGNNEGDRAAAYAINRSGRTIFFVISKVEKKPGATPVESRFTVSGNSEMPLGSTRFFSMRGGLQEWTVTVKSAEFKN